MHILFLQWLVDSLQENRIDNEERQIGIILNKKKIFGKRKMKRNILPNMSQVQVTKMSEW